MRFFLCLILAMFLNSCNSTKEYQILTEQMISIYNPPISAFKRKVLIDTIVRVSVQHFDRIEDFKYFLTLISIESAFNPDISNSHAGAVGLTQLIPKYSKEFSTYCNLPNINPDKDLKDSEVNLLLGACVFKTLLKKYNGNAALAMGAYNAGSASLSVQQINNIKFITNVETSGYLAKAFSIMEKTK